MRTRLLQSSRVEVRRRTCEREAFKANPRPNIRGAASRRMSSARSSPGYANKRHNLAIAQWPDDAPRGSVTSFYAEHGISRKTFYAIRARARDQGQTAALGPRSRRPKTSPSRITEEIKQQALGVRRALESSGLDHGPISVYDKMISRGLNPPSVASLARTFRENEVARQNPTRSRGRRIGVSSTRLLMLAGSSMPPNTCWSVAANV